jgi:hypothetical protein
MSELVAPVVTLEFHEISRRGRKLPEEAMEFSTALKPYIAGWAGEAGITVTRLLTPHRSGASCVSNDPQP